MKTISVSLFFLLTTLASFANDEELFPWDRRPVTEELIAELPVGTKLKDVIKKFESPMGMELPMPFLAYRDSDSESDVFMFRFFLEEDLKLKGRLRLREVVRKRSVLGEEEQVIWSREKLEKQK